jgi:hypothetical protein
MVSCTPLTCFEDTESFLKASFYKQGTETILAPDSITMYGVGNENLLFYKKAIKVQPVLFALNPSVSTCTYIIKINALTDTIKFTYNNLPHLISKECGYTYYYNLTEDPVYTKNAIKFLSVTKGSITTLNEENIRIYY